MRQEVRNVVSTVHRWSGLTLGVVALYLALTGAGMVLRPDVEAVTKADLLKGTNCAERLSLDEIVAVVRNGDPNAKPESVLLSTDPGATVKVRLADEDIAYVDACSGAVLGRDRRYGGFFGVSEWLHRMAFMDRGNGRLLGGVATLFLIIALLGGGLWLWWPRRWSAWKIAARFNPRLKGQAFSLNLHTTSGLYGAVVIVSVAVGGLLFAFDWAKDSLYWMAGSPAREPKRVANRPVADKLIPLETAWKTAQSYMPDARQMTIYLPRKKVPAVQIIGVPRGAAHERQRDYLYLDAGDGSVIKFAPYAQSSLGDRLYGWITAWHNGLVGGLPGRLVLLFGMLALATLGVTGIDSYVRKWRNRGTTAPRSQPMFAVRVERVATEGPTIKSFMLARMDRKALPPFAPGAHIDVKIKEGMVRQYSLCNGPQETGHYLIAVKRSPESRGGSKAMHDEVKEDDVLYVSPPRNLFPLASEAQFHLLLAAGIGVTPLLSMARHLKARGADFMLHYFVRETDDIAFRECIEGPELQDNVLVHVGFDPIVQEKTLATVLADPPAGAHAYACGPNSFMAQVTEIAARQWPEGTVHFEHFGTQAGGASQRGKPFDVFLAKSRIDVAVMADQSLVQALRNKGVTVPTACEQGFCGTCLTDVLEGSPEHRDSFLSDAERKSNKAMLPCVSRACERLVLDL